MFLKSGARRVRSEENQNAQAENLSSPTESTTLTSLPSDVILSLSQTSRPRKNDSQRAGSGSEVIRANLHSNPRENRRDIASSSGPHNLSQDFFQYLVCTDRNLCSKRSVSFEHIREAPNPNDSDPNHSSTSSTQSLSSKSGRGNRISGRNGSSFPRTEEALGNPNRTRVLQNLKITLASIQEEKEIMRLTRQLSAAEAEKAAGFPDTIVSQESEDDIIVRQKIMEESKHRVPEVKSYSGGSFFELQTFERSFEDVFDVRPTTYRKDVDRVFFGRGELERIPITTWYRREDKLGRLDIT